MPFSYHPPTGRECKICAVLHKEDLVEPIIDSQNGKASSANNYPFHNWYNFVLGYSPQFPLYILGKEKITSSDLVVDPFMGSGTTLLCAKAQGIPSKGIDANDFMVDAARAKLYWNFDITGLKRRRDELVEILEKELLSYDWGSSSREGHVQLNLFNCATNAHKKDYLSYVQLHRPELMTSRYISDKPFAKACIIANVIQTCFEEGVLKQFLNLALASIILPISNIKYGPGFGVVKAKDDVDVLEIFMAKLNRMIKDLESVEDWQKSTPSDVILGDSRLITNYIEPDSVSFMITSPPYPGDHEYTKYTKLELLFKGYATTLDEFRVIKKRMLRASTTNLYHQDFDREVVRNFDSIKQVTDLIHQRLEQDGATSGFEKLYTKLTWEYFGGMYKVLEGCLKVLKPGGKIALLVSDSHAFKMVHIQTAKLLQEIGETLGFVDPKIMLWQLKTSTSHNYYFRENILILSKPA